MSQQTVRRLEKINIQDPDIQFVSIGRRKCLPLFFAWSMPKTGQYILHYVLDGVATLRFNNRQVRLQKGDVFVSFSGCIYQFTADKDEPL